MRLSEILKIPKMTEKESKIPLSQEKINNAVEVDIMGGGYQVFKCSYADSQIAFFCKDEKGPVSIYVLIPVDIKNISGYLIQRNWTRLDMRKKGIASDLFVCIHKLLKKHILSDEAQTPDSQALWKSLSKRYDVKALNTRAGEIFKFDNNLIDTVYTLNDKKSADYLLIIEKANETILPEKSIDIKRMLTPYRLFEEGDA